MTSPNQEEFDGVVVAEPLTAIKDPIFLNRFEKAFEEQIMVSEFNVPFNHTLYL